jgi:hypothetical protein
MRRSKSKGKEEYFKPKRARLQSLLTLNGILQIALIIILGGLAFFVFKFILLGIITVQIQASSSATVIDMMKAFLSGFFHNLGDLTGRYMFFVSLILLVCLATWLVNVIWHFFSNDAYHYAVLAASLLLVSILPVDRAYSFLAAKGFKDWLLAFCLALMASAPFFLAEAYGTGRISVIIVRKISYIVVFGLLLAQLFIDA